MMSDSKKQSSFKRFWSRLLIISIIAILTGLLTFAGLISYYGRNLPDISSLRDYRPPQTTRVLDRNGALIGEVFEERRTVVPISQIPRVMVLSVLAAEDADFYVHPGFDYRGIMRAILRGVIARRPTQGASTITQQIVKLLLLSPERTFSRKIRELILARQVDQELSKEEILHLYLNHINFGSAHYGIEEAAQYYFHKHARELNLAEASLLAGIPQSPTHLNPYHDPIAARRRQLYVLGQLESKRAEYWPDLTAEEIQKARNTELHFEEEQQESSQAPELMQVARQALRTHVGQEALRRGGYTIYTTFDLDLQKKAREAVRHGLETIDQRHRFSGPLHAPERTPSAQPTIAALQVGRTYDAEVIGVSDNENRLELNVGGHRARVNLSRAERFNPSHLNASQFAEVGSRVRVSIDAPDEEDTPARARLELGPQGAAIVIDVRSHDVLAMVGSYETTAGFNRATQAIRQPGSTFKPFVYVEALRRRLVTPATTFDLQNITAPVATDEVPISEGDLAPVRLRSALARSLNPVAIRLLELAGPQNVITLAHDLGISTDLDPVPSLALGASDVHLIELVNAYSAFAAGGQYQPYRMITKITGPGGQEIQLPSRPAPKPVLTPAEAFLITSLMRSVVDEGTATAARVLRRPLAGKTGTSNEARDTWFVGFSPEIVTGVWVGFDDRRPLGHRESGARAALPIWIDIMRKAENDRPIVPFVMPSGIVTALIDPITGLLAPPDFPSAIEEFFLQGTVPTEYAISP